MVFSPAAEDGTGRDRCQVKGNNHSTVKPVTLFSFLVSLFCPPGGVVLDPFLGSGTTLVSCLQTGRRGIGIEREKDYCDIALARCRFADREAQDKVQPEQPMRAAQLALVGS